MRRILLVAALLVTGLSGCVSGLGENPYDTSWADQLDAEQARFVKDMALLAQASVQATSQGLDIHEQVQDGDMSQTVAAQKLKPLYETHHETWKQRLDRWMRTSYGQFSLRPNPPAEAFRPLGSSTFDGALNVTTGLLDEARCYRWGEEDRCERYLERLEDGLAHLEDTEQELLRLQEEYGG